MVHASFIVEASSSTRVCVGDGGELVPEVEGMQNCQSACISRAWEQIDMFVATSGQTVSIARQGRRDPGGQEHIAGLTLEGDTAVLRGKGCTRRIPVPPR
jgi:hypothetical protein